MGSKKTTKPKRPLKEKVLDHVIYGYVKPVNGEWLRRQAAKEGVAYSRYLDSLIEKLRTKAA